MRWEDETTKAAEHLGWTVVDTNGVDDWQGWGVHLLRRGSEWGVLAWSYGSCGGCDSYDGSLRECGDDEPARCAEVFGDLIETRATEEEARQLFSDRKGW